MQVAFDFGQTNGLTLVRNRLRKIFRPALDGPRRKPLAQMVRSMLGSRTYDAVSESAFKRLVGAYPRWEALAAANPDDVERIISSVTFAEKKAPQIVLALNKVRVRAGAYDLDFLEDLDVTPALAWLEQLTGVGRKVAAATLNFSTLRKPALVIETHVLRVLQRLGFVSPSAYIAAAYETVMPSLAQWSADELLELHVLMKKLGQIVCMHDQARCSMCPLENICRKVGIPAPQPFKAQSLKSMKQAI
jgi:endonuclease-3